MKFSEQWLRELISPELSTQQLADKLTMAGLEVDGIAPVAGEFSGVVIGDVVSTEKHPDADKLQVCEVSTGDETQKIVCGAPNARAGLKVCVAKVGAVLPGGIKIKKAKLRGVVSMGMLCSESELGLAESANGIMELPTDATIGIDVRDYLKLDDQTIDIDLTANRGDCLSIQGIAREMGALLQADVCFPAVKSQAATSDAQHPSIIENKEACPYYLTRVIEGIDNQLPSPWWLQEKLRRCGVRSLSLVVDVTNYVMLLMGQPMHAFDRAKIGEQIIVRHAAKDEAMTLLDGQKLRLKTETLLIADENQALALAGIMGSDSSAVSESTTAIVLESAFFVPEHIAGKARQYGLHTESSHRFERGVDPQMVSQAMTLATQLILELCGGQAGPVVINGQCPCNQRHITLEQSSIKRLLGQTIDPSKQQQILAGLGFGVEKISENVWQLSTPSWRFDLSLEEDVIEELARVYGFDQLKAVMPKSVLTASLLPEKHLPVTNLKSNLVARGYREVIAYSFIDPKWQPFFLTDNEQPLLLQNPIASDMAMMRPSQIPGLLQVAVYNLQRQQSRLRLFEVGRCFKSEAEVETLSGLIVGPQEVASWHDERMVDFYDIKGDVESLLGLTANETEYEFRTNEQCRFLHPGQSAVIVSKGRLVGCVGAIHPHVAKHAGLKQKAFVFELFLDYLSESVVPKAQEISKFPSVRRDLAIVVDESVAAQNICQVIQQNSPDVLQSATIFDVYHGENLASGKKSLALSLNLQALDRTLSDDDINDAISVAIAVLEQQFNAKLRD